MKRNFYRKRTGAETAPLREASVRSVDPIRSLGLTESRPGEDLYRRISYPGRYQDFYHTGISIAFIIHSLDLLNQSLDLFVRLISLDLLELLGLALLNPTYVVAVGARGDLYRTP